MATIKASLVKQQKQDGTYPLYFILSHNNRTARIASNISLLRSQWDDKKRMVVEHPQKKNLNFIISQKKLEIEQTIERINGIRSLSATELKDKILSILKGEDDAPKDNLATCFARFIEIHDNSRTKEIYNATWKWITKYAKNADSLSLSDIDKKWLDGFSAAMKDTSLNSKSIHLRNLRAIFNWAIDNDYTQNYPFRRYKIKQEATRKRSLDIDKLRELMEMEVEEKFREKYLDFFRLQFLLIGINTIDLLQNAALVGDRIEYRRAKTKRLYSIKAEPEAMELINKYKGKDSLLNFTYSGDYRNFTLSLNRSLNSIANISSYWARHTWATVAASLDIPKDTIAAALGHGGNSVTDIYIDFDQRKVDEANRKVIDYVLYDRKIERKIEL